MNLVTYRFVIVPQIILLIVLFIVNDDPSFYLSFYLSLSNITLPERAHGGLTKQRQALTMQRALSEPWWVG